MKEFNGLVIYNPSGQDILGNYKARRPNILERQVFESRQNRAGGLPGYCVERNFNIFGYGTKI